MTPNSETQSRVKLSKEREARRIATEALRLDEVAQSITPTGVSWDGKEAPVEWGVALVRVSRAYLDAAARLAEVEGALRQVDEERLFRLELAGDGHDAEAAYHRNRAAGMAEALDIIEAALQDSGSPVEPQGAGR